MVRKRESQSIISDLYNPKNGKQECCFLCTVATGMQKPSTSIFVLDAAGIFFFVLLFPPIEFKNK
jgi:hypothetical protein